MEFNLAFKGLILSTYYLLCINWLIKCLIIIDARCKYEDSSLYVIAQQSFWYCKILLLFKFVAKFVVMVLQVKTFMNICKADKWQSDKSLNTVTLLECAHWMSPKFRVS